MTLSRAKLTWLVALLLVGLAACTHASTNAREDGSNAVSTLVPPAGTTGQEVLREAQEVLDNATSFEATRRVVFHRDSGDTVTDKRVLLAEDGYYIYDHHGRQITEVIHDAGIKYWRSYFEGYDDTLWQHHPEELQEHAFVKELSRDLHDLEGPRIIGITTVANREAYLIEGTAPIPITLGGPGHMADFEPGLYRLLVETGSMEPISLTSTLVTWIEDYGTPSPDSIADMSLEVEFISINQPVEVTPPPENMPEPGE